MKFRIWKIDEFRKLCIYSEQVFDNWKKFNYKEGLCLFALQAIDLRYKLIVIPLGQVSSVTSWTKIPSHIHSCVSISTMKNQTIDY